MPLVDFQAKLGIDVDKWLTTQSAKQPHQLASVCHVFEKEWLECSDGIGLTRAKKECKLEMDDLNECTTRLKMVRGPEEVHLRACPHAMQGRQCLKMGNIGRVWERRLVLAKSLVEGGGIGGGFNLFVLFD